MFFIGTQCLYILFTSQNIQMSPYSMHFHETDVNGHYITPHKLQLKAVTEASSV